MTLEGRGASVVRRGSAVGSGYGTPVHGERLRGHLGAHVPWPQTCIECCGAGAIRVDDRLLCRIHGQETLQ